MTTSNSGRVAGKCAFVTGAGGGLGAAIARRLVEHGARVFLTDRDVDKAATAASRINDEHGEEIACSDQQDVRDEDRWQALLQAATQHMGGISILVNSAGVGGRATPEQTDIQTWRHIMEINAEGTLLGCKHGLPHLRASAPASIVNLSSLASCKTDPNSTAYGASKAAVASITKSVAVDCAHKKDGVRCNSVHPAFIHTGMVEPLFQQLGEEAAPRILSEAIPMGRLGEPDDVAWAVLYLASDESRYVTAAELMVDGGARAT